MIVAAGAAPALPLSSSPIRRLFSTRSRKNCFQRAARWFDCAGCWSPPSGPTLGPTLLGPGRMDRTASGWESRRQPGALERQVLPSSRFCCRSASVVLFGFGGLVAFAAGGLLPLSWLVRNGTPQWQVPLAAGIGLKTGVLIGLVDALLPTDFINRAGIPPGGGGKATWTFPVPWRSFGGRVLVLQHRSGRRRRVPPAGLFRAELLTLGCPWPGRRRSDRAVGRSGPTATRWCCRMGGLLAGLLARHTR